MLSFVTRWNVLPRLHTQSVAEHSYYVSLYTDHLCKIMKLDDAARVEAVSWALRHDMAEVITGDIMGPVKRMIANHDELSVLEGNALAELGYVVGKPSQQTLHIVKAANCIDEYFWLSLEVSMGNNSVRQMQQIVADRMVRALDRIQLASLTATIVGEYNNMLHGLGFPQKDSDLG